MIYLLLIIILFMAIEYYNLIDHNLISPSILLIIGYIIAVASAIMNIKEWGINLHTNTVILLIFGIFSFMVGCIFARIIKVRNNFKNNFGESSTNTKLRVLGSYKIAKYKLVLIIIIQVITLLLLQREVHRIASFGGYTAGTNMMTYFRQQSSYSNDSMAQINIFVKQLMNITQAAGFCFTFIFIRNVIVEKKIIKNLFLLIPSILFLLQGFLQGGRGQIIKLVVIILVSSYITYATIHGWKKNINSKFLRNGIVAIIIFFIVFYLSKELVGRVSDENFFEYITRYTGGSIQLLDMYMQGTKAYYNGIIGTETFPGLITSLTKLGILHISVMKTLEFRTTITGIYLGNIYTGLRRFYNDFGWSGVFMCQFLMGFILESIYRKIRCAKEYNSKWSLLVLIYSYLCSAAVQQAMEDVFYISMISVGFIIQIIILFVMFRFITQVKSCYRRS